MNFNFVFFFQSWAFIEFFVTHIKQKTWHNISLLSIFFLLNLVEKKARQKKLFNWLKNTSIHKAINSKCCARPDAFKAIAISIDLFKRKTDEKLLRFDTKQKLFAFFFNFAWEHQHYIFSCFSSFFFWMMTRWWLYRFFMLSCFALLLEDSL
jgi:hypothetical protein